MYINCYSEVQYSVSAIKAIDLLTSGKIIEMKGDVGMSVHEKERKQEDAYTKTQTHS